MAPLMNAATAKATRSVGDRSQPLIGIPEARKGWAHRIADAEGVRINAYDFPRGCFRVERGEPRLLVLSLTARLLQETLLFCRMVTRVIMPTNQQPSSKIGIDAP
jgi:hypothetical protein